MASLEEVKDQELEYIKPKTANFQATLNDLESSVKFLSAKCDKFLSQSQAYNEKQRTLKANLDEFKKELICAQYLRRDCVEISGIQARKSSLHLVKK